MTASASIRPAEFDRELEPLGQWVRRFDHQSGRIRLRRRFRCRRRFDLLGQPEPHCERVGRRGILGAGGGCQRKRNNRAPRQPARHRSPNEETEARRDTLDSCGEQREMLLPQPPSLPPRRAGSSQGPVEVMIGRARVSGPHSGQRVEVGMASRLERVGRSQRDPASSQLPGITVNCAHPDSALSSSPSPDLHPARSGRSVALRYDTITFPARGRA